jgi:hypothetical protein
MINFCLLLFPQFMYCISKLSNFFFLIYDHILLRFAFTNNCHIFYVQEIKYFFHWDHLRLITYVNSYWL